MDVDSATQERSDVNTSAAQPSPAGTASTMPEWWRHLPLLVTVDVCAMLCKRFKPLRNIPKRCLSAFCDVMDAALLGVVSGDIDVGRRCSRLWLLLPRLLLGAVFSDRPQVVARGGDMRRMIRDRLRRFHDGEWVELLQEAHVQQQNATAAAREIENEAEDEAEAEFQRVAGEVIRLCRLNEVSRAMARLTSSGIAPPSRGVAEMLRREITGGHIPSGAAPGIGFDWRHEDFPRVRIDPAALRTRLRQAPRGSSPSASGWR